MNENLKNLICAERYKICICNSAIIGFDSSIPNLQYKNLKKFPIEISNYNKKWIWIQIFTIFILPYE